MYPKRLRSGGADSEYIGLAAVHLYKSRAVYGEGAGFLQMRPADPGAAGFNNLHLLGPGPKYPKSGRLRGADFGYFGRPAAPSVNLAPARTRRGDRLVPNHQAKYSDRRPVSTQPYEEVQGSHDGLCGRYRGLVNGQQLLWQTRYRMPRLLGRAGAEGGYGRAGLSLPGAPVEQHQLGLEDRQP
jgi:hypothetical protein